MSTELAVNITIGILQVIIGVLTLFQRGGIIFQARRIVQEGMSIWFWYLSYYLYDDSVLLRWGCVHKMRLIQCIDNSNFIYSSTNQPKRCVNQRYLRQDIWQLKVLGKRQSVGVWVMDRAAPRQTLNREHDGKESQRRSPGVGVQALTSLGTRYRQDLGEFMDVLEIRYKKIFFLI
jgi:hypothetical protein